MEDDQQDKFVHGWRSRPLHQASGSISSALSPSVVPSLRLCLCALNAVFASAEAGAQLWTELFSGATRKTTSSGGPCMAGGPVHRARLRLWQTLAVLSAFVQPHEAAGVCRALLPLLAVRSR